MALFVYPATSGERRVLGKADGPEVRKKHRRSRCSLTAGNKKRKAIRFIRVAFSFCLDYSWRSWGIPRSGHAPTSHKAPAEPVPIDAGNKPRKGCPAKRGGPFCLSGYSLANEGSPMKASERRDLAEGDGPRVRQGTGPAGPRLPGISQKRRRGAGRTKGAGRSPRAQSSSKLRLSRSTCAPTSPKRRQGRRTVALSFCLGYTHSDPCIPVSPAHNDNANRGR